VRLEKRVLKRREDEIRRDDTLKNFHVIYHWFTIMSGTPTYLTVAFIVRKVYLMLLICEGRFAERLSRENAWETSARPTQLLENVIK
jgi:hypothetical protein